MSAPRSPAVGDAVLRPLEEGEEERFLSLLDRWPLPAGVDPRSIFARYVADDPTFRPDNVWVAELDGRLASCVQIFPRILRSLAGPVPCGGIGSVLTLPEARRRGLASRLLGHAAEAMRRRGMEVSLLVATRRAWYGAMGWHDWSRRRVRVRPGRSRPCAPVRECRCEVADLAPLGERHAAFYPGTVERGDALWRASGRLAGTPEETLRCVRTSRGELGAYARLADLEGGWQVLEWGYAPGAERALATLLVGELARHPALLLAPVPDEGLLGALDAIGAELDLVEAASWMLRCLDAAGLKRRLELSGRAAEEADEQGLLERLFPRARFGFWASDRF